MEFDPNFVMGIAGESGYGIMLAGDILTLAAARRNIHVSSVRIFPAEVRGGASLHRTRYGVDHCYNQGDLFDILIAITSDHYEKYRSQIEPHSVIMMDGDPETYDPTAAYPELREHTVYIVPMDRIAREEVGNVRSKNMVAVGACCHLFNFDRDKIERNIAERYKGKDDIYRENLAAFVAGNEFSRANLVKRDPFRLQPVDGDEGLLVVSGNEAIGMGGLWAGCRFFGGYPITPASEIMEFMAAELPKVGGVMLQAEDEISSMGMVIGAAYTGVRSMTATSGPGLSLMAELLGLSGMAEVPLVVVDVQRGGPSTGLPTKTEQGDFDLARVMSHGESPKVVMAPISIHDCFDIMFKAFEIAEKYQIPVIVLTEQALSHRRTDLPKSILTEIRQHDGKRTPQTFDPSTYLRFRMTESGISERACPGDRGGAHIITGLEHGENGMPRHDPEHRVAMMEKRLRKMQGIAEEHSTPWLFGRPESDIGIIGWGATAGVVREAVERAAATGISSSAIYPKILFPNPDQAIRPFIERHKAMLVVEENQSGQYANYLQSIYGADLGFKPERLNKFDGNSLQPAEVLNKIYEIADKYGIEGAPRRRPRRITEEGKI